MILIQSITKVLQTLFLEFPSVRILYAHICSTCTKNQFIALRTQYSSRPEGLPSEGGDFRRKYYPMP